VGILVGEDILAEGDILVEEDNLELLEQEHNQ
jgi:hypothetical protein